MDCGCKPQLYKWGTGLFIEEAENSPTGESPVGGTIKLTGCN